MEQEATTEPTTQTARAGEKEFARSFMECMRNMATITAYSFGSSYLIRKHPPILGSPVVSLVVGGLLFLVTVFGVAQTASLFVDSLMAHHVDLSHARWQSNRRRAALFVMLLAFFLSMAAVPWVIVFQIGGR